MKKILVTSTALVAFGIASAAQASSPIQLQLGGTGQWLFGVATQKGSFKDNVYDGEGSDFSSTDIKGNNFLNVNGSTVLDNGMKVGLVVVIRAGGNSNANHMANDDPIDRSYAYVEGRVGKLMVGTVDQAPKVLQVIAPDAAGLSQDAGLGIVSGRWVMAPNKVGENFFYLDTTKINTADASEKIVYYTPRFAGFTLGLSFAPGTATSKWSDTGNRDMGTANETYALGLGYDNRFGNVGLKAALGWQFSNSLNAALASGAGGFATPDGLKGESGTYRTDTYNDYNGGLQVSLSGFTLGADVRYRDINKTTLDGYAKNTTGLATYDVDQLAWSVGAQYAFDPKVAPLTVSLNYYDVESKAKKALSSSQDKKDRVHNANLSAKYELGTGVNWLGSVGWIKYSSNDAGVHDNSGIVVLTGLGLAF